MVNTKGIGLGLSISNLIVKKFNGILDFTSEVGIGSNFFFTFELNETINDEISESIIDSVLKSKEIELVPYNFRGNEAIMPEPN